MPYILDGSLSPLPHYHNSHASGKTSFSSIFRHKSSKSRINTGLSSHSTTINTSPAAYSPAAASPMSPKPHPVHSHATPTSASARTIFSTEGHSISPTRRRPPPEAPPAYSPPIATADDDRYAFLSQFDTVFLIDDSGSMAGRSWHETAAALAAITPICTKHDADGIDIYFLNHKDDDSHHNLTRAADVEAVFSRVKPMGGTLTGTRLHAILRPYMKQLETKGVDEVKPLNIIVITDGVPSDEPEDVIVSVAKKLDKWDAPGWQVGIQFFQVGNEDGAAEALEAMDNKIGQGRKDCEDLRDIVDTVPWSGETGVGLNADGILKVVLGAVNRKLDRKRDSGEWRR